MAKKFPKIKAHSLGAAVVEDGEDETELDLDDVELEDDDTGGSEEEAEDEELGEEEEDTSEDDTDDSENEPARRTRSSERIRKLNARRRESEARTIALQQELDRLRAQSNASQHQNDAQARAAYLASLPADQRVQAELQMSMQAHQRSMQIHQFQMADTADKAAFDAKAINDPLYRKYGPAVEKKLKELRDNQGITAPREEVLKHILGEAMLKRKGTPVSKKTAKQTVKNQQTKNGSNKSNLNGGKRNGSTARERLEGVTF